MHMEKIKHVYKILISKPLGKKSLGRPMHRWKVILRHSLEKWDARVRTGVNRFRIRPIGGRYNEPEP